LILPDYNKNCIVHIPGYIKYLHGVQNESVLADDSHRSKKTILFVIDGFGYKQWNEHQSKVPILKRIAEEGTIKAVASMFPSSTAPSITGLSTGLTTQQHGLVEWTMYESTSQQIINTLPFKNLGDSPRDSLVGQVDPHALISNATLFQNLAEKNIKSFSIISDKYAHSTYSTLAYAGSTILPFSNVDELFNNLGQALANDEPQHVNIYWDEIDSAGHTFGPNSNEYATAVTHFFSAFDEYLSNIYPSAKTDDVQVMITADHGQIAVNPSKTVWLDELPFFVESLEINQDGVKILPWGLQRDVYAQIQVGKLDQTI
jgi:predicted AlkP superfamily pyrophosphatase or phosphodiesterase